MALIKLNNRSVKDATAFGSISSLGELTFISKQTASSSATISFTSGIDSTYKEYLFTFNNIHAATDNANFQFQANASGGSGYNETITSTFFSGQHREDDSVASLGYRTGDDQAQGTSFQTLVIQLGNGNDECCSGYLHLFNPSNTTFVKHFISRASNYGQSDESADCFVAGYVNTTTALTRVQFKFASGNMDTGTIKMYGVV